MIGRSDSSATTQTSTNCLNNIPSRLVSWLYAKMVRIAEAVKRIFSRGKMGQSESLPETRPLVERTSSEVKAETTFLHTPDPQETAPFQEVELDNVANRPLSALNGNQVLCLSRDVTAILDGMKTIFEELKEAELRKISEGEQRAECLEKAKRGEHFDVSILDYWESKLHATRQIVYPPDSQESVIIDCLVDVNARQMEIMAKSVAMADSFIKDVNETILPSIHELISRLTKKYPVSCTDLASEEDLNALREKVVSILALIKSGVTRAVMNEIAFDDNLSAILSSVDNKLQYLIKTLKMNPWGAEKAGVRY